MAELKRKIIQIAIDGQGDYCMALCNDGTLWQMGDPTGYKWEKLKTVPQPGEENE